MKVLGLVASARPKQHTARLVRDVIDNMCSRDDAIESEVIHVARLSFSPCRVVCADYCRSHPYQCSVSDAATDVFEQMAQADALVIGAPQYFRGPPAAFYTMVERMISMCYFPESQEGVVPASPLAGKPCGLVAVAEYSNPQGILEYLNEFCRLLGMKPISIDSFPYLGVSGHGDIDRDEVFRPFERSRELAEALITHAL